MQVQDPASGFDTMTETLDLSSFRAHWADGEAIASAEMVMPTMKTTAAKNFIFNSPKYPIGYQTAWSGNPPGRGYPSLAMSMPADATDIAWPDAESERAWSRMPLSVVQVPLPSSAVALMVNAVGRW
jgi:hypothetical protein